MLRHTVFIVVASLAVFSCAATTANAATWISVEAPKSSSPGPQLQYSTQNRFQNVTAHFAWISNPVGHFHVYCPNCTRAHQCTSHDVVSVQAKRHNCLFATNGGPFKFVGDRPCIGSIVSDGVVISNQTTSYKCIGLDFAGWWRLGEFKDSDIEHLHFANFLCGFGWLVQNNSTAGVPSGGEIAPRTAIGLSPSGKLLIFEADGCEGKKQGLTLLQTALWMQSLGATEAINLDGGGSSTAYYSANGGVQGCPTCIDIPYCCERSVTTVTCISSEKRLSNSNHK